MQSLAIALPVAPGKSERAANLQKEIDERRRAYEELNDSADLVRHIAFLQTTPMGDFVIMLYQGDDLSKLLRPFTGSDYDNWWLGWVKDVHGLDLAAMTEPPPLPKIIFSWEK